VPHPPSTGCTVPMAGVWLRCERNRWILLVLMCSHRSLIFAALVIGHTTPALAAPYAADIVVRASRVRVDKSNIVIRGVFATRLSNGTLEGLRWGYMYFYCPRTKRRRCKRDYRVLATSAGSGTCRVFGRIDVRHPQAARVRHIDAKLSAPDRYPLYKRARRIDVKTCSKLVAFGKRLQSKRLHDSTTDNGGIAALTVYRAIYRSKRDLRRCLAGRSGKLAVTFVIASDGTVMSAKAQDKTRAARCLVAIVKRMRFPKPRGGGLVAVEYPFTREGLSRLHRAK